MQIFFSQILVLLKNELHREWNGRFRYKYIFSFQLGSQDKEEDFIGSEMVE